MKKLLFAIYIIFIVYFNTSNAQIECQVTVNTDKIQGSTKDLLQNFAQDIQNYINSNKWTNEDLGGEKIQCTMNIFLTSTVGDNGYSAQVFIGSQRPIFIGKNPSEKNTAMLRVFDDQWQFTYIKNQALYRNESQYDALTDFIDFYMYLIVGLDYDSYDVLSGTPYYQKAFTICNAAPSSSKGWERNPSAAYNKFSLIEDFLNPQYQQFREALYTFYFHGLDVLATKPQKGYENIISALEKIAEVKKQGNSRSLLFKTFFDTKYQELADILKNYGDENGLRVLVSVDASHQIAYEEAFKNK